MGSSSLIRDQTQTPCTGSVASSPLDHQGSPLSIILYWSASEGPWGTACPLKVEGKKNQLMHPSLFSIRNSAWSVWLTEAFPVTLLWTLLIFWQPQTSIVPQLFCNREANLLKETKNKKGKGNLWTPGWTLVLSHEDSIKQHYSTFSRFTVFIALETSWEGQNFRKCNHMHGSLHTRLHH